MKPQRIKPTRSKEASFRLKLTVLMTFVKDSKYLGNSGSQIPEKSSICLLATFVNMLFFRLIISKAYFHQKHK